MSILRLPGTPRFVVDGQPRDLPGRKPWGLLAYLALEPAGAQAADLGVQDKYGVKYLQYWVDENDGEVFCLVEAPDADAAVTVHREAHGLVADEIYPVVAGE